MALPALFFLASAVLSCLAAVFYRSTVAVVCLACLGAFFFLLALVLVRREHRLYSQFHDRKHVVILGGGFAALAAARRLSSEYDVTLVDAKEYFEFTPGMCRPFADPDDHSLRVLMFEDVCKKLNVHFVWGRVTALTETDAILHCRGDVESQRQRLAYDYCIVALGCQYGLPLELADGATDAAESLWCAGAKEGTLEHREQHIAKQHSELQRLAESGGHVAVVGAGLIGVEYAAELRHFFPELEISVLESRDECCSSLCSPARQYIQRHLDSNDILTAYGVNYHELGQTGCNKFWERLGRCRPAKVFMSVGVRPRCEFMPSQALSSGPRGGWIRVNESLQVVDERNEAFFGGRLFACGSCVGPVPGLDPLPKNVFPAEEMAAFAAKCVQRLEAGKPLSSFWWPWFAGLCATSLGPRDGVFVVNNRLPGSGFVAMWGRLVAWQKEFICYSKLSEYQSGWLGLVWYFVHS